MHSRLHPLSVVVGSIPSLKIEQYPALVPLGHKGSCTNAPYQTAGHGLPTENSGLAPSRGTNFWTRPLFTEAV